MGKYGDDKAQRGFVIENVIWDGASDRAKKEGVPVSAVIRAALEAYSEGDPGITFADALAVDTELAEKMAAAKAALAELKALKASKAPAKKASAPAEKPEPAKAAKKASAPAKPAPKTTSAAAKPKAEVVAPVGAGTFRRRTNAGRAITK
jgi:hypothetical protein